jgi:short-subunit dehydrogenase
MSYAEQLDTVLITGASTGIGATYADRLARRGHPLVLVARSQNKLQALAERLAREYGVKTEVITADLTRAQDRLRVEQRLSEDPAIGWLLNSAGMAAGTTIAAAPVDAAESMIQLNIVTPTRLIGAILPRLLTRGQGSIINIASMLALAPELFNGGYAASKSYLLNYTLALQKEIGSRGIRVQAVLPGVTRTELWQHTGGAPEPIPPSTIMEVDELVDAALTGYDQGEVVTIPSLIDSEDWDRYESARRRLAPHLSRDHAADRYKSDIPEDA